MIAYIVKLVKDLSKHWTASRAQKIDAIENRLSSTRMSILDGLNNRLNSIERALNGKVNQVSIENLTKKVEGIISAIASKASQTSLDSLKKIVEDLSSRLTSTRAQKLDNLDTTVSSRADKDTVNNIYSKVNQGMVKRVQRGIIEQFNNVNVSKILVKNGGGSSAWVIMALRSVNVTLPYSVNPNKSISTCEWSRAIKEGYGGTLGVTCRLTGLNTITFDIMYVEYISSSVNNPQPKAEVDIQTYVTWQVIEYY